MKKKIVYFVFIMFISFNLSASTLIETPEDGSSTVEVDIPSETSIFSIPVDGSVPLEEITDDCELQTIRETDLKIVGYEGTQNSGGPVKGFRGYIIGGTGEDTCTATINTEEINPGIDNTLEADTWTMISPPEDVEWSKLSIGEECEIKGIGDTSVWSISLEGNDPVNLEEETELTKDNIYWIRTQNDCTFNPKKDWNLQTEEGSELSDDLYFFDIEAGDDGEARLGNGADDVLDQDEYEMADGNIRGRFVSEDFDEGRERTLKITNLENDETASVEGSGEYLRYPILGEDEDAYDWGTEQLGVFQLEEGSENDFEVEVKVDGETVQSETYTLTTPGAEDPEEDDSLKYDYEARLMSNSRKLLPKEDGSTDLTLEDVPRKLWFEGEIKSDKRTIEMELSSSEGGSFSTDNYETLDDSRVIEIPTESRNREFGPDQSGLTVLGDSTQFNLKIDEGSETYEQVFTLELDKAKCSELEYDTCGDRSKCTWDHGFKKCLTK